MPPGVDLGLFTPGSLPRARAGLGIRDDAQVLLFVGRIQPPGRLDVLLRAAARLSGACGSGCATGWSWRWWAGPGSGLTHPRALEVLAAEPRSRRRRALRRAAGAGRAAGLVPRGRRHRRPLLQRVLRPGGHRVAGLRDTGRRRLGRRPAHGVADGRPPQVPGHDPDDYAAVLAGLPDEPRRRAVLGTAPSTTRRGSAGVRRRPACWTSTRTCSPSARCRRPSRSTGDGPPAVTEEQARALVALLGSLCTEPRTRAFVPGTVVVSLPGERKPQDDRQPGGRRAQPVRQRVRGPPPGREPRGGLPLDARAQHPALRRRVSPSTTSGRLPERPAAPARRHAGRGRPAARRGPRRGRLLLHTLLELGFAA